MKLCSKCKAGYTDDRQVCAVCGQDLTRSDSREHKALDGMVLGEKYQLLSFMEEGGMSWIYRGQQLNLKSLVAVKLMKQGDQTAEIATARFLREAGAAARINHPHVITVLDSGAPDGGLPFIICELLEGVTLADLLENLGCLPVTRALTIFNQLLSAVEASHHAGVIHRDLKPENVMLSPRPSGKDFVKVLDFGIAQTAGEDKGRLGEFGQAMGTPAYMSPEQATGRAAAEPSDLYACAVMLFEMLTGLQPFVGETVAETLSNQLFKAPPSVDEDEERDDLPPGLDGFFEHALAKDPAERIQTVPEMRRALYDLFPEERLRRLPCRRCHRLTDTSSSCSPEQKEASYLHLTGHACDEPPPRTAVAAAPRVEQPTMDLRAIKPPALINAPDQPEEEIEQEEGETARREDQALVRRFLRGPGKVLQITAPLGAGKSTLLAGAARWAEALGMKVLGSGPDMSLVSRPWGPVRGLLEALLLPRGENATAETLWAGALRLGLSVTDLPGLMDIFGVARQAPGSTISARFLEAVAAARRTLVQAGRAELRPVLILLDDTHLFDSPSLQVIQTLCGEGLLGSDVKVLLTAEGSVLAKDGSHQPISLGPLTSEDVVGLIQDRRGLAGEISAGEAAGLRRQVGSNLLQLKHALAYLDEGGAAPPPSSLGELIKARLEGLPTDQRQLLEHYAAAWPTLGVEELGDLLPVGTEQVALRHALEARGWLTEDPGDFQQPLHPAVAGLVCNEVAPSRLAQIHGAVFKRLEQREERDTFVLAGHAFMAELGERGYQLQRQAAAMAMEQFDMDGAGQVFLSRAASVALRELSLAADHLTMLELTLDLARALSSAGHYLAAEDQLYQLQDMVPREHTGLRARGLVALAQVKEHMGEQKEALEVLGQAARAAAQAGDHELMVEAWCLLGEALLTRKGAAAAGEALRGWFAVLQGSPSGAAPTPGIWRMELLRATVRHRRGDLDGARQAAAAALASAKLQGTLAGEAGARLVLGQLAQLRGNADEAEQQLALAHLLHMRLGDRMGTARCLRFMAELKGVNQEMFNAAAQELQGQLGSRRSR